MQSPLPIKLFNTLTRKLEDLTPMKGGYVGIYCCGPTVYDYQHIGNFKTFLFEDLLVRTLRFLGYQVKHVMNITDVGHLVGDGDSGEDKMLVAMRREKKKSFEIAAYYTDKFFEDWDKLHLKRPDIVCKATDHISEMIELIQRIEAHGFTYIANGNVYFDVSKFQRYGELAKLDVEKLKAGARIEVDPHKKNPLDFVLWFTKSKFENQELQWDSPWGQGYPGWHIECSAMSIKHLGEQFDIHCGGIDHIPVHHTNEIAQSEAATQKPWVRMWLHSEFMLINAEKMAKSKGKTVLVDDIIQKGFDPLVFRYLCLGSHYRSHLNFTWEVVENANSAFQKLKSSVLALKAESGSAPPQESRTDEINKPVMKAFLLEFQQAMQDDLNSPRAFKAIWSILSSKELSSSDKLQLLYAFDQIFGLGMQGWQEETVSIPAEVHALLEAREKARQEKNWAASDKIRQEISTLGYGVKDSPQGPVVRKL